MIYYTLYTKMIKYRQGISSKINLGLYVTTMAISLVEFSMEGYKIRKVFGPKKTLVKWNHWILQINGEVSKSAGKSVSKEHKIAQNLEN